MKMVWYRVKEDDLHIHAADDGGFRLGWYQDDWVIDIGFAQQWLLHYRQWSPSSLLPIQSIDTMFASTEAMKDLQQLYQQILQEDWTKLLIHGEPVSLPSADLEWRFPLNDPEKLIIPAFFDPDHRWLHPSCIVSSDVAIPNAKKAFPGIAFMLGMQAGMQHLLGCSLLNCWMLEKEWIASLGPYLFVTDQWRGLADQWLMIRHNDRVLAEEKINLWQLYQQISEEQTLKEHLTFVGMVSIVFDAMSMVVEPGDQFQIQMAYLGQLQNRVDKT